AKPTKKHLKKVKRIFRYLRGTVNTGLWYKKDSGFELTGFSDADYAGCKDTFKSTFGGAQFLGEKLLVLKTDLLCLTKRTIFHGRLVFSESTSNSSAVGGLRDSKWIKLVSTGYRFWSTMRTSKYGESNAIALEDLILWAGNPVNEVLKTDLLCLTKRTMFHGRLVFSGDSNREVPMNETFHVQTDDELTEKELKQIEADDQAIQTILLGLPEDIYAAVDSCETAQEIWLRNEVDELKAERLAKTQDPLALMATSNNSYTFPVLNQDQPSFNQNYMQQPMPNPEDITYPTTDFIKPAAADLDEIEKVNANCILMANLQQASTSGTHADKALVYDSDGSAEVHNYEDCYDNDIFNMFTQEEQYTELLELIPESHQVPHNDNNVISEVTSMEQSGRTVEQHPVNIEETRVLYDSLYQNLAIEVEKVNTVNRKLKKTNAEQCLSKKINALHLSSGKQIMTLNEEISDLNKQLSKEKSTVSFLLEEKKKLKSDFKICEDKLLYKQIQLEKRIKELDNILVKTGQSIQTIHMLSPKPDSFYHTEHKMALGYQNPFYLKQAQQKQ
nr:uncharacterized mitochondrial protein AtMg00810-like [Tanacetum cinerariifolium]